MRHLFLFATVCGLCAAPSLHAQASDLASGAELSADEPLERDLQNGVVTARGNAEVRTEDIRITADLIQYYEQDRKLIAEGHVTATGKGLRLLTDELTYDLDTQRFNTGHFRAGYPPFFIEGENAEGTPEEFIGEIATLYYGEPATGTPRLRVGSARVRPGERVRAEDIRFGVQGLDFEIPIATLDRSFPLPPIQASVAGGYRGNLGAYVQSELLFPFGSNVLGGTNLDVYTNRGALVGPIVSYRDNEGESTSTTTLNSGWIYDYNDDERGDDRLNQPIDPQRYFARLNHRQTFKNLSFNAQLNYVSDSEILRDFRWDLYPYLQEADSHFEVLYTAEDWFLTAWGRTSLSSYYPITERLPEVRLQTRLRPITEFNIYHRGHLQAGYLRRQTIEGLDYNDRLPEEEVLEVDFGDGVARVDGYYELQRPSWITNWLRLTPNAAARYIYYGDSPSGDDADRLLTQVGLDLTAEGSAYWNYQNKTWNINGLRHIVRPMVRYLYREDQGADLDEIYQFDYYLPHPSRPLFNLGDRVDVDSLSKLHVTRVGVENTLQTRGKNGQSRNLVRLDLFQDFDLEDEARDALYTELSTQPAPWLDFRLAHKWRTEDGEAEAYYINASVLSADKWRATMSVDHLEDEVTQIGLSGFYRLTENIGVLASARYDDELGDLPRQLYAVRQRWGSFWEFDYGVLLTNGDQRQDDMRIQLKVRFLAF